MLVLRKVDKAKYPDKNLLGHRREPTAQHNLHMGSPQHLNLVNINER